jgi:hypothetical protein
MPTSGVELTQFGYWITYPPLGPENWSNNPPPSQVTPQPTTQQTPVVQFKYNSGYLNNYSYSDSSPMDYSWLDGSQEEVEINITLIRSTSTGTLSPDIIISNTNVSNYISIIQQPTFNNGQTTATLQVLYVLSTYYGGTKYAYFSIVGDDASYSIGQNNPFYLDLFFD